MHAHLVLALSTILAVVSADTFVNNRTGEVVRGTLLEITSVGGESALVVRDETGTVRNLADVHWRRVKPTSPKGEPGTDRPTTALPSPPIPVKDFKDAKAHKVVRVIGGDNVVVLLGTKETTVHLVGVDTPDTVHPSKPVEAYGKEASAFVRNLLVGESVYLEYEPGPSKLDKYGRTLAYLYRAPDGLFVNLEIVRQGYGHAYTAFPFQHMELFRAYERRARIAGKGLWAAAMVKAADTPRSPVVASRPVTVYGTRAGKKYHRADCRYLSRSRIPVSLTEAKRRGLTPCSVCRPPR